MISDLYLFPTLFLQNDNGNPLGTVFAVLLGTAALAALVAVIVGTWHTFTKAGEPGWGIFIPIFNLYLMTRMAGRPGWWTLLMIIPLINVVFHIIVNIGIAENFGKSAGFGIGMFFLPFIFYPMLGFGDAVYTRRNTY